VADTRNCEQCGTAFAPRREHARFCSARCRVAWNRENNGGPPAEVSALDWAITAMSDTTERLPRVRTADRPRVFAVIGEAVWWVTIVDGTLVRYHPEAYDAVLTGQDPDQRQLTEETLAGLRFVRNQMGQHVDHVDFIEPVADGPGGNAPVTAWTWNRVPAPTPASQAACGPEWELTRYRGYQSQLAGRTVGEVFDRAVAFLRLAAAQAASATDPSPPPAAMVSSSSK
jgi:hypothetical protein